MKKFTIALILLSASFTTKAQTGYTESIISGRSVIKLNGYEVPNPVLLSPTIGIVYINVNPSLAAKPIWEARQVKRPETFMVINGFKFLNSLNPSPPKKL